MAKFIVSLRDFVCHQQKELRKPFLNMSSRYMVNPVYNKHVKTGYWQNGPASKSQFLKSIPEFDIAPVSMVLNFNDTNRKSQNTLETVDDIDLLIGYISEQMVQGLKDKVGRLLKDVRPGFDGEESRLFNQRALEAITL